MKKRLAELEESLKTTETAGGAATEAAAGDDAAGNERDRRSVFVGNVHFKTVPQDLQEHFKDCGEINQITILVDKHTGQPKGYPKSLSIISLLSLRPPLSFAVLRMWSLRKRNQLPRRWR